MSISMSDVKALREETSAPIVDVKEALTEANGDYDAALKILAKRGKKVADKKASRDSKEGIVGSYVHTNGKIGVLVKVHCETDFVARNEDFQAFVKDVALQIAASSPQFVKPEDVTEEALAEEKERITEELKKEDKPEDIVVKITEGKLAKARNELALLTQSLIKDADKTVSDLLEDTTARLGEKIEIGEFVRFEL